MFVLGKNGTEVKNKTMNTDILRCLNICEHDTGDFLLKMNLVAFAFDLLIDRIILMEYHRDVEMLDDEYTIEFELEDKSIIDSNKT